MFTAEWTDDPIATDQEIDWIWHGILAGRQITILTGLWRAGKTTLLSHLLHCRHAGGTLLGQDVRPGVTAVVTEESRGQWRRRIRLLPPGPNVCFFYKPFLGRPTRSQFDELVAQLLELRQRRGLDLVALDTLTSMLPIRTENNAEQIIAAFTQLRRLTDAGVAVLLPHHPAKGNPLPGQAARGSGVLSGLADILLELRPMNVHDPADRRRLMFGYSRSQETPPLIRLALNAEGTEYTLLPDEPGGEFPRFWPVLLGVLEEAPDKLTRLHILENWPADFPRPSLATLWRWLDVACERKLICCAGTHRGNEPFRYWLPAREQQWLKNPLYRMVHGLPPLEE